MSDITWNPTTNLILQASRQSSHVNLTLFETIFVKNVFKA